MILQCSECGTKFLVDSKKIGAIGRTVKCTSCGHQWFAEPEDKEKKAQTDQEEETTQEYSAETIAQENDDVDGVGRDSIEDVSQDIKTDDSYNHEVAEIGEDTKEEAVPSYAQINQVDVAGGNRKIFLIAACIILFFVMIGSFLLVFRAPVMTAIPATETLYSVVGLYSTEGLVLEDVAFKKPASKSRDRFLVTGYIVNRSDVARKLPLLKVSLVDEKGDIFLSREYHEQRMLKPGERFAFKAGRLDTAFRGRTKTLLIDIGNGHEVSLRK